MTHNERVMQEYNGRDMDVPITELQVEHDCMICFPRGEGYRLVPESDIRVLSPHAVVHRTEDYGDVTFCGKDCTGPGWWHRL